MSGSGAPDSSVKTDAASPSIGEVTLALSDIEEGLAALPRAKMARYVSWFGAVAVAGLVGYRWIEGRDRTSLIVIAVVLLFILALNRNPAKRIAKRVYTSLSEDAKKLHIAVSDDGFRVGSSGSESLLEWANVRRLVETRNVLVVFVSQHDAQILPKRAFTEGELESIRSFAQSKVQLHDEPWLTPELRTRMMIWLVVVAVIWLAFTYLGKN